MTRAEIYRRGMSWLHWTEMVLGRKCMREADKTAASIPTGDQWA